MDFEKKLSQLEKIVTEMEGGELSLDESLKKFEQGVKLSRECHVQLSQAEQKVKKLVDENGDFKLDDFEVAE